MGLLSMWLNQFSPQGTIGIYIEANRMPRQSSKSPRRRSRNTTPSGSVLRGFFSRLRNALVLLLIGLVLALSVSGTLYVRMLDRELQSRFDGHRWALPARVYARPLELYAGRPLRMDLLRMELEALGFHEGEVGPGRFRVEGDRVEFTTRGFLFADGQEPARSLRVQIRNDQVTEVLDRRTGHRLEMVRVEPVLIGSIYPAHGEDRILLTLDQVPRSLIAAIIAVEDRRFFSHRGVDPWAIFRAAWSNLQAGRTVQGGSTLTQQLVRNLYLSREQSFARKGWEALLATLLEYRFSKEEILEAYLNEIFLGQVGGRAIHGFASAADFYFQRPLDELSIEQIALLVGLARGASFYDPRRFPQRALARRNLVLTVMAREGLIPEDRAIPAQEKPLGVGARPSGSGTRFPAFLDLVRRELRADYREGDLRNEGLRIFTTLDPGVQLLLERQVLESFHDLVRQEPGADELQIAAVVTDPRNGEILAVLGGRDPRFPGFNRAVDARRPVGSLLKPFVALSALVDPSRYTLATMIDDSPLTIRLDGRNAWSPQNFDRRFRGQVTLWETVVHSYNVPMVRIAQQVGVSELVRLLRALGLESTLETLPSLALGAADLSLLEVAGLYQALANGGYATRIRVVREVLDQSAQPLSDYPVHLQGVIPDAPVQLVLQALHDVTQVGTGRQIARRLPSRWLAGKTGSSTDLRDSWFAGFDARTLAIIWLGRDDNQPHGFTGSSGALPLWIRLMEGIPSGGAAVHSHPEIERVHVDLQSGLRTHTDRCPHRAELPFWRNSVPRVRPECDLRP